MPKLSILDLEQRININAEATKYLHIYKDFQQFVEKFFFQLPYVGTSRNLNEFFQEREIYCDWREEGTTKYVLYLISFYETYVVYREFDDLLSEWESYYLENKFDFNILIRKHNTVLLEFLNYQVIYEEEDNQYGFKTPLIVKRDTDVDSVLPLVNSDIRIDLLSYLDFRVEHNLQAKEDILARLYKTIIDDGKEIYFTVGKTDDFRLKYQNELYERIKLVYNQTNIRHGGQGKIELPDEEKHKYYDMCFYLLLQLIRTPKSIEDMKEIKDTFAQKQKANL